MQYRPDIDGLRAIAVGTVVLGHAGIAGFSGGFVGVDIFFVISGYLICTILASDLEKGRFSLVDFYERRARRILPALFAMFALCFGVGWFFFPPPQYESLATSAVAATFFVSNLWFITTTGDYFSADAEFEPLLHTWSLAVEEQFYLVFPILLWVLYRWARKGTVPLIALGCAASLVLSVWATSEYPVANFYSPVTRAWELGIGALQALVANRVQLSRGVAEALGIAGLAAIAYAVYFYTATTPFPGLTALAPVLGSAAIILAGLGREAHPTLTRRLLSLSPMVGLGLISYSLYLFHWPVLVLARGYAGSLHLDSGLAVGAILVSVVLAWLSWRFVEQPFRKRGPQAQVSRGQVFAGSLGGAVVLSAVAALVIVSNGFWQRSPTLEREYQLATTRSPLEDRCWDELQQDGSYCTIGAAREAQEPSIFIWGDSHAGALLAGFEGWLDDKGLVAAASVERGCAPFVGVDRIRAFGRQNCGKANSDVLQYILDHPEIETVVIVARWPMWLTGTRLDGEAGEPLVLKAPEGGELPDADREEVLRSALAEAVDQLAAADRRVILVSGIPEMGRDIPGQYLSAAYIRPGDVDGLPIADVRARQASSDALLRAAADGDKARIVDFPALVCDETCPASLAGKLLYRDDDHLSVYAAELYVPGMMDSVLGDD